MVTLEMIQQAQQNLKGVARLTPLISAPKIGTCDCDPPSDED